MQSFKAGPDYIDSGLHRLITGRPSRNLDLWMCGEAYVKECFRTRSADSDFAVVEGVMGLFDGERSTAALAAALGLPVVLVIDAYGMAETSGAVARGFKEYATERRLALSGVIFNRVASSNHFRRLTAGPEVPVLGYVPRDAGFEIPHRHLGLEVAEESPIAVGQIDRLAAVIEEFIDLDALLATGGGRRNEAAKTAVPTRITTGKASSVIAVAYDRAFNFYYEDNLDFLRQAGAEIVRFSPLRDSGIPEGASALYIGGGYPEIHAGELSRNRAMLGAVRNWAMSGKPLYAECGGLMYLSRGIHDFDGNFFEMAGVFPFETRMKKGRSRLGYREVRFAEDCLLGGKGETARGHEFHYSEIIAGEAASPYRKIYTVQNGSGDRQALEEEGYAYKKTLASYIHLHFGSNPHSAEAFVNSGNEEG